MTIVYTTEEAPESYSKSIFLAGPSPREQDQANWREEALTLLDELGFDGVVYVPLPRDGDFPKNYDGVREWERKNLDRADAIVFWIPRDMKNLPGLTTNIEWGVWFDSGRAILGYPLDAPHMRYLAADAKEQSVPIAHTLKETLQNAIRSIGTGSLRTKGERDVPLQIWKKTDFQQWWLAQVMAGNRLDGAKVVWTFRVGPHKNVVFLYSLHVNVWIESEGRAKTNEVVIFRPSISVIGAVAAVAPKHLRQASARRRHRDRTGDRRQADGLHLRRHPDHVRTVPDAESEGRADP
jgi:nucleoside 2-deoxyribosyltransferase